MPTQGIDYELDAGSRAHYDDATYYTQTYGRRLDDVQFYVTLAEKNQGPVLEYGVGNGRIALPIARHGVHVMGVDQSAPMLRDLKRRIKAEPQEVRARLRTLTADMRRLRLKTRFPLVICPFNTALHLYSRTDVEHFLERARKHLTPRGQFVMDLSIPVLEDLQRDPTRAFSAPRFRHPSIDQVVRYREHFDYDRIRQIMFVSMEFEPLNDPKRSWVTPLAHRQFFPQEWEALLHYNGFEIEKVEGDFHGGLLDRYSDVMVWHCRVRKGFANR